MLRILRFKSRSFYVHGKQPSKKVPVRKESYNMDKKFQSKHLDFKINQFGEMSAQKLSPINPIDFANDGFLASRTISELRELDRRENEAVVEITKNFLHGNNIETTAVRIGKTNGGKDIITVNHIGELTSKSKRLEKLIRREITNNLESYRSMSLTEKKITKYYYAKVSVKFIQEETHVDRANGIK